MKRLFRLPWEIADSVSDFIGFAVLGLPERRAKLFWRERKLDRLLAAGASENAIAQAALDIDAAALELEAGRSLDESEMKLLRQLQDSGATTLEIWILFLLSDVWRPRKPRLGYWQPLPLITYACLAVLVASTTALVSYSATRQAIAGDQGDFLWVLSLGAFLVGLAGIWDLYFRRAPAARRKWRHIIEPSPSVSRTTDAP